MTEGLIYKLKPTARDIGAAIVGGIVTIAGYTQIPKYLESRREQQEERQREMIAEGVRQAFQQRGIETTEIPQDALSEIRSELQQTREAYKSLEKVLEKIYEKLDE